MQSSKRKPVKKYFPGGILAIPAIAQGVMGLGQSIFGMSQARKAREAIKEIQKNAPNIRIPTAIRQLADEPIAEEYMEAQELGAQRRTATAIDALGRGGSRSLGILPSVMEQERVGEQQRAGQYEQMRQSALSALGQAEDTKLAREMDQYAREIGAARQSQMAGQQNIFGGLGQIGRGVAAIDWSGSKDGVTEENIAAPQRLTRSATGSEFLPTGDLINIPEDPLEEGEDVPDPFAWLSRIRFNKGGMLPKYQDGGTMNDYAEKARSMRKGARKNPDGSESTVKMAWTESDGKYYAYPTLFQKEDGSWYELSDDDNWAAFEEARRKGEVFEFPSKEQAEDFAGGAWKPRKELAVKNPLLKRGGLLPKYKMGGDMPMKTEGEFNHNTNPKALIDEKTGEKQAELTGDEVILNKDQYKKMQKLAEEGKAEELLAYYKKLSAKFEKEKA